MSNLKLIYRLPIYILAAGLVSSCGSSGSFSGSGSAASTVANTTTSTSTSTGTSTSTSTVTGTGPNPALAYSGILVTGPGGTAPTWSAACNSTNLNCTNPSYITTTNLLQVQVTPATGGLLAAPTGTYSGFSANYNCASYQVEVLDTSGDILGSQQTGMLALNANAPCMDASGNAITTTSQVLNFSPEISQSNHGLLDIRVQAVDYDFYCKMLYDYLGEFATESEYYNLWCPSKVVYYTHTVGASIEVEVNGTSF